MKTLRTLFAATTGKRKKAWRALILVAGFFMTLSAIGQTVDITCPSNIAIECDESTDPANTGTATSTTPGAMITFSDVTDLSGCGGYTGTITRTWVADDGGGNSASCDQIITVEDTTMPEWDVEESDITINTVSTSLSGNGRFLIVELNCDDPDLTDKLNYLRDEWTPNALDNCDNDPTVTEVDDRLLPRNWVCPELDRYTVVWTAEDDCGNITGGNDNFRLRITILDTQTPEWDVEENDITISTVSTDLAPNGRFMIIELNCDDPDLADKLDYLRNQWTPNAMDNCDNDPTVTEVDDRLLPRNWTCPELDRYTVVWTAEDDCGNITGGTDRFRLRITILDTQTPTWDVEENDITISTESTDLSGNGRFMVVELDCGDPDLTDKLDYLRNQWIPNAVDNCDSDPLIEEEADFEIPGPWTCPELQRFTVVWAAEDDCGNRTAGTDRFRLRISITDAYVPTLTPACLNPWNVNESTVCPADATPNIAVGDILGLPFALNVGGTGTWTTNPGCFTDNCTPADDIRLRVNAISTNDNGLPCQRVIELVFDVGDDCDNWNIAAYTINVTVSDNEGPTFTVPVDVTIECDENEDDLTLTGDVTDATDNCDPNPSVTYQDNADLSGCGNYTGTITRTWIAEDNCGNSTSQDQIITVVDTQDPTWDVEENDITISVQNVDLVTNTFMIVSLDCGDPDLANKLDYLRNQWLPNTEDNCDTAPLVEEEVDNQLPGPWTCPEVDRYTVVWAAEDDCGNRTMDTERFRLRISLFDNTAPTFTVPANTTIECDDDPDDLTITGDISNLQDDCDQAPTADYTDVVDLSGCGGYTGTITRTWTATDACGNSFSQDQIITVVDTEQPVITSAPGEFDMTINLTDPLGSCPDEWQSIGWNAGNTTITFQDGSVYSFDANVQGNDNCDNDLEIIGCFTSCGLVSYDGCTAIYESTWRLEDDCSNQSNDYIVQYTFIDAAPPVYDENPGDLDITYDVTDPAECPSQFILNSNTTPSCGTSGFDITTLQLEGPNGTIFQVPVPGVTDACTPVCFNNLAVLAPPAPVDECNAVWTFTFTGQDDCDNVAPEDFVVKVTLRDLTPPQIAPPAMNMTVECDGSGNTAEFQAWLADHGGARATDCTDITWTYTINNFDNQCCATGVYNVTFRATDECDNFSETTAVFTIDDSTPPDLICPDNLVYDLDPFECDIVVNYFDDLGGVYDVCCDDSAIDVELVEGLPSGSRFEPGRTRVVWTATDACDNTGTCEFEVIVNEYPDPGSMICNNGVQVSLESNCTATIRPDDILEGSYGCVDDFLVEVLDGPNPNFADLLSTSPMVTGDEIGMTLAVEVTNTKTKTACWGTITVEDKSPPLLVCPQDRTVDCDSLAWLLGYDPFLLPADSPFGPAEVEEECCLDKLSYTDNEDLDPCGAGQVIRTWSATDCYKNVGTCQQVFTFIPKERGDILWPADLKFDCNFTLDELTPDKLEVSLSGEKDLNGLVIQNHARPRLIEADDCLNIAFAYDDNVFNTCEPYSFKIRRTWTVIDWCDSSFEESWVQFVKVVDEEAPQINCPADKTISTTHTDCFVFLTPDPMQASDNCDPAPSVTKVDVMDETGTIVQTGPQVPTGNWIVKYEVSDACGNTTACQQRVTVKDNIAPVAICDQNTQISLAAVNGYADLCGSVINDGSYDNCGPVTLEVRAPDLSFPQNEWSSCIRFFCNNVGDHIVELKVTDESGNYNTCWANVAVEDKSPPVVLCPPNITVDCGTDFNDPENTGGEATGQSACESLDVEWTDGDLAGCVGTFIRTWTATKEVDGHSGPATMTDSCDQRITLVDDTPASVIFPEDITLGCPVTGTDPADLVSFNFTDDQGVFRFFDEPQLDFDCEQLGVSIEEEVYDICLPAGYKIHRTWHVIDWCDPNFDISHVQVIKVEDIGHPEVFVNGTQNYNVFAQIQNNRPTCDTWIDIQATAIDDCSAVTITNNSPFSDVGQGSDASGYYPRGTHVITFTAIDACNNITEQEVTVTVNDIKSPQAVCLTAAVDIKSTGIASVTPFMLDNGSTDNCTDSMNLEFKLELTNADDSTPLGSDLQDELIFTCDEAWTVQFVRVFVIDDSGNESYCVTSVAVQDNSGHCGPVASGFITATAQTEEGEDIDEVDVYINEDMMMPGMFGSQTVSYQAGAVVVEAYKDKDLLNGVTTYDIIMIRKHLLNLTPFTSPYQWIAANIDNNDAVSTIDIVHLRRAILNISNEFPNNFSWRFIDAAYAFSTDDPLSEDYQEFVDGMLAPGETLEADFVGVKVGDINGSVVPNSLVGTDDRSPAGTMVLEAEGTVLTPGEWYTVTLRSKDKAGILGYQFTLEFDPAVLAFSGLELASLPGLTEDNFGLNSVKEGLITTSWDDLNGVQLDAGQELFTLRFQALEKASLAEVLRLNSRITRAEAYDQSGRVLDVALDLSGEKVGTSDFALYQNRPNPFAGETMIGFELPKAAEAELYIYDMSGRQLTRYEGKFAAGYNEWTLRAADLPASGVLYYELVTDGFTASRKMVLMR